jgi:hypothetical protein
VSSLPSVSRSLPVSPSDIPTSPSANVGVEAPVTEANGGELSAALLNDKVELMERLNALEKACSHDLVRQFPSPSLQLRHKRLLTDPAAPSDQEKLEGSK